MSLPNPGPSHSHQLAAAPSRTEGGPAAEILEDYERDVILALDMKSGSALGCSYYTYDEAALCILEDVAIADENIIEAILLHIQPATILVPSRIPEELLKTLNSWQHQGHNLTLRTLNSTEFAYSVARDKIIEVVADIDRCSRAVSHLPTDHEVGNTEAYHSSDNISQLRAGSHINLNNIPSVGCAGAVLADIYRRHEASAGPSRPKISAVRTFTLTGHMYINMDSIQSLQILRSEAHPSNSVPSGRHNGKENLSVFGLFYQLCNTVQGKYKLRQALLRPTIDMETIRERQAVLATLIHPSNSEIFKRLISCLNKVGDARRFISQLERGQSPGSDSNWTNYSVWAALQRFATYSIKLSDCIIQLVASQQVPLLNEVLEDIVPRSITAVGESISRVVDFEQSEARCRTTVAVDVDPELDNMKHTYDGIEDLLAKIAQDMNKDLSNPQGGVISRCIFYPQLGFLTEVQLGTEARGEPIFEIDQRENGWEKMFTAHGGVYYKNKQMRDLDEHFGDIYGAIVDREIEILHCLANEVLQEREQLVRASNACGELDYLVSLGRGAQKFNWVAPTLTTENVIQIRGGRHPLQELVVPTFIPNDCRLWGGAGLSGRGPTGDFDISSIVLTGPNHSGKSVYLKQVALIVHLAHVGSFVPAESAVIGITDQILTRLMTRESVGQNESAFAIDLRQMAFMVKSATRRSLILVDEFGKGTRGDDGAGLMASVINHFSSLGPERPKLLAATHLHEIFEGPWLSGVGSIICLAHMKIRVDPEPTKENRDCVTNLFSFQPGKSTSSFGSQCAAINGVDSLVVERAEAILVLLARNENLRMACAELSAEEVRKLEQAEEVARRFLSMDFVNSVAQQNRPSSFGALWRGLVEAVSVD